MSGLPAVRQPPVAGDASPSDERLEAALARMAAARGRPRVRLLGRRRDVPASTAHAEVVLVQFGSDGARLFCKLAGPLDAAERHHALAREAAVYREVLEPLGIERPWLFGFDAHLGLSVLATGYQRGKTLEVGGGTEAATAQAAAWLGRFHATAERAFGIDGPAILQPTPSRPLSGWAERTVRLSAGLRSKHPWVERLCERATPILDGLDRGERVALHGEYFPANILVTPDGSVVPVDWESAGVGPGVFDLAMLTDGWPEAVAQACLAAYREARWPNEPPALLPGEFDAARLLLQLRWLGDRAKWTTGPENRWRFGALLAAGRRLGLVDA